MHAASAATFFRFIPTLKARFDYGLMIFILTFNLVAVSGYRVEQLLALAQWRFCTITLGFCICLTVCIVVCPVWAGEELHCLTIRNMEKLAESLEGIYIDNFLANNNSSTVHLASLHLMITIRVSS